MFARFFVDRPIFATVLSLVIVIVGLVALDPPAHRPVSRSRPADDPGLRRLSGRRRGDGGHHRGHSHRAGSQRRRADAVHGVALHQRRPDVPGRDLRAGDRSGHGPGARAEPRFRGPGQAARRRQADRRDHEEEVAQHPAVRQPGLGEEAGREFLLRPALPEQLRLAQREGRPGPRQGRGRRDLPRPARLQHAGLARSAEARLPGHDAGRRDQGHPRAERPGCRRPARATARAPRARPCRFNSSSRPRGG